MGFTGLVINCYIQYDFSRDLEIICYISSRRDRAVWLACEAHNLEVGSSNLPPAITSFQMSRIA